MADTAPQTASDEPESTESSTRATRTARAEAWVRGHPVVAAVALFAVAGLLIASVGIAAAVVGSGSDEVVSAESFESELTSATVVTTPTLGASIDASAMPTQLLISTPRSTDPDVAPATELYAFYVNWGDEAYDSLEANAEMIDVLVPMWYHLDSNGNLTVDDPVEQAQVLALVERTNPNMKVMPLVNNYDKSKEAWNAPAVAKLLRDPKRRAEIAQDMVTTLDEAGFDGMNIDFESFTENDRETLVAFMEELYPRAKKAGLTVSMDVIVGSKAYDHTRLAQNADFMVPMMYDEHWKTSPPGPISSQAWFEKTLAGFYEKVPPEKVVVGLGVYSYDYGRSGQRAASLTWQDAAALAKQKNAVIELDGAKKNAHFSYKDGSTTHQVWMLDAASAFNQMAFAEGTGPRGYAFWRLGAEDPGLWKVIPERSTLDADAAAGLQDTRRKVRFDESSGLIVEERLEP